MYFRINASSVHFCGFDSTFYVEAENEDALYDTTDYADVEEFMYDYVGGSCSEEDYEEYGEDADEIMYHVEEIDAATWEEEKTWDNRFN